MSKETRFPAVHCSLQRAVEKVIPYFLPLCKQSFRMLKLNLTHMLFVHKHTKRHLILLIVFSFAKGGNFFAKPPSDFSIFKNLLLKTNTYWKTLLMMAQ